MAAEGGEEGRVAIKVVRAAAKAAPEMGLGQETGRAGGLEGHPVDRAGAVEAAEADKKPRSQTRKAPNSTASAAEPIQEGQ